MDYRHIPVLLAEVLQYLKPRPGQNYIDATLGGGGYTEALAQAVGPQGQVLAIDLDTAALENFQAVSKSENVALAHGNFAQLDTIVKSHMFRNIDGIVADIGLSSYQLDESGRGISFQKDEPLDMRFDRSTDGVDASFILNEWTEDELFRIFSEYGEEHHAYKLAQVIVRKREESRFKQTTQLVEIIKTALPKPKQHLWAQTARRIFQALRIAVNHELENLEAFLPKALDLLNPGGRLAIVSFHSLEDRMVKQFFVEASKGCVCPPEFPQCQCGRTPAAKILTKKPITATETELEDNSRSKSAKLRVLQKI